MCCRSEDTSGPSKNKEGFGGKGRREHMPCWPVVVHKQGVVFEMDVLFFKLGCYFQCEMRGAGSRGSRAMRNLHSQASFPLNFLCNLQFGVSWGGVRAPVPQDFPSLEIPFLHLSGLCRGLAHGGGGVWRYLTFSDGYGGLSPGMCERKVAIPRNWVPVRQASSGWVWGSCDRRVTNKLTVKPGAGLFCMSPAEGMFWACFLVLGI